MYGLETCIAKACCTLLFDCKIESSCISSSENSEREILYGYFCIWLLTKYSVKLIWLSLKSLMLKTMVILCMLVAQTLQSIVYLLFRCFNHHFLEHPCFIYLFSTYIFRNPHAIDALNVTYPFILISEIIKNI